MNKQTFTILAATTILVLAQASAPAPAQAQSNTSQSTQATAAIVNNTPGSGGTDLSNQVPPAYAPGLDSGTNNCAVSASAGGSGSGFGISLGASVESEDCQRRQWYTLMMKSQKQGVAWAIACQTEFVREAAADTPGLTCPDQPTTEELQQASNSGDVPGYCDDGGFASAATIRANCPNAEQILD
jgi:hypothetical protein